MTVNPGFGGQPFIEECVPNIQQVAAWRQQMGLQFRIEVDGGIKADNAWKVIEAGANGLIDPSRKRPGLWHLVLFRWNEANGPKVRVIGA
jgi:pentose-5-phosphate-3-epimerase